MADFRSIIDTAEGPVSVFQSGEDVFIETDEAVIAFPLSAAAAVARAIRKVAASI